MCTKYFAYGSNLNSADWRRWCRARGVDADLVQFQSIGFLPDFDIAFNHFSHSRNGGVLNLIRRPGQLVQGAICEVHGSGWKALDRKEGAPHCYQSFKSVALDLDGKEIVVKTYHVPESRTKGFVAPTAEYVEIVRNGLENYGLSEDALEMAAKGESLPRSVDGFFVYGTLMRNEPRFPVFERFGLKCTLLAQSRGRLLELRDYPGLIEATGPGEFVQGEFIRVADLAAAIMELDRIEGFVGFGHPGNLFRRALVQVDVGDGRIRDAWAYYFAGNGDKALEIPSGDWREHRGHRDDFHERLIQTHSGGDERRIAADIASGPPYYFDPDHDAVTRSLLPLKDSLMAWRISERKIAQASGSWVTVPPFRSGGRKASA